MGVNKRIYTAGGRSNRSNAGLTSRGTKSTSAAKATGGLVVGTGFAQLDAKLAAMPAAMQRKLVRGGLKRAINRCVRDAKRIVKDEAYDTGVLHNAFKSKALKRSRKKFGYSMFIGRETLFQRYAAKHGGQAPHPAKGEKEPFYYPAVIEFGSDNRPAIKPMRRALYDNADEYRELFKADVLQFIAENKVTTALPKASK